MVPPACPGQERRDLDRLGPAATADSEGPEAYARGQDRAGAIWVQAWPYKHDPYRRHFVSLLIRHSQFVMDDHGVDAVDRGGLDHLRFGLGLNALAYFVGSNRTF
jgi:hypothetical protein